MPRYRTILVVAGVAASFAGFAGITIYLSATQAIDFPTAKLMLVALLAIYVGVGILFAIYRLIDKLE